MKIIRRLWRWIRQSDKLDEMTSRIEAMHKDHNGIMINIGGLADLYQKQKKDIEDREMRLREQIAELMLETGHEPCVTSSIAETMEHGWIADEGGNGFWEFTLTPEVVRNHEQWKREQKHLAKDTKDFLKIREEEGEH